MIIQHNISNQTFWTKPKFETNCKKNCQNLEKKKQKKSYDSFAQPKVPFICIILILKR